MQLRLLPRLFITFATLSIAALLAFGLLQQNNFQRGFLDYLNRLSLERLEEPAQRLGKQFKQQGNWQFVKGDRRGFMSALGLTQELGASDQAPPGPDEMDFRRPLHRPGNRDFPPPPGLAEGDFRPPPPLPDSAEFADGQQRRPPPPNQTTDSNDWNQQDERMGV